MGHGYKGGSPHFRSIGDNLNLAERLFEYHSGFFGIASPDSKRGNRNIPSDDPKGTARKFYATLSYGGKEHELPNGRGVLTELKDGTIITFRLVSSSDGTPVAEINVKKSNDSSGVRQQKIHFISSKGRG